MGCQGVRWQGVTTQRATARKKEQRSQRAPWRLNRVCSPFTQTVSLFVAKILSVHGHLQRIERGQLLFLGSTAQLFGQVHQIARVPGVGGIG